MTFITPSTVSLSAFMIVVAFVIGASLIGMYSGSLSLTEPAVKRTGQLLALWGIWLALTSYIVGSGLLEERPSLRLPMFFFSVLLSAVLFGFSRFGTILAYGLPLYLLVAFQGFRFPLELVLHAWSRSGTIPETMTWTGNNYDIFAGIFAIVAASVVYRAKRGKRGKLSRSSIQLAWASNLVGWVLLLNVIRVTILSSPLPFGWHVTPPLQLAVHLPYAAILTVCVFGALAGQVILTRTLMKLG